MTTRAPSDWTRWLNEDALRVGQPILVTQLDQIMDDLAYFQRRGVRLISDVFRQKETTTATVATEVVRWPNIQAQDLAGATAITGSWLARVWVTTAGATGRLTLSGGTGTDTVDFTNTSPAFAALQTGYTIPGNGADFTPIISLHRTAGAGAINCDAFFLMGAAL